MDAYKRLQRIFDVISIGSATVATKLLSDWLTSIGVQQPVLLLVIIVLIYCFNEGANKFFAYIFSSNIFLRQFFLGDEFVEGVWIEFLHTADYKNIESVGIVSFEYDKNACSIRITGENYQRFQEDSSWYLNYRFSSKENLARMQFPTIDFAYVNRLCVPVEGKQLIEGVAQVTFSSIQGQGIPLRYHTSFSLTEGSGLASLILQGWKIQDKRDLKILRTNPSCIYEVIHKYEDIFIPFLKSSN